MKRIVRAGVFETNSSSTHSLTMMSLDEFNKWKSGELLYDSCNDVLVPTFTKSKSELRDLYIDIHVSKLENGFVLKHKFYKTLEEIKNTAIITNQELASVEERDPHLCSFERFECMGDVAFAHFTSVSGDSIVGIARYYTEY